MLSALVPIDERERANGECGHTEKPETVALLIIGHYEKNHGENNEQRSNPADSAFGHGLLLVLQA